MILNEILTKQNILNALLLKVGEEELSKELKVKIVRIRIAYNKIRKQFDEDVQEFTSTLIPTELTDLQGKSENELSETDKTRIQELVDTVNTEYREFMLQKGLEEIKFNTDDSFSEKEFDEIVGINAGREVSINGGTVNGEILMEAFYDLFVSKTEN